MAYSTYAHHASFTLQLVVKETPNSPVMLQRSRNVGASPEYWLIMPLLAA
jgi:hypothetical protein